jgi:PX domain-containing protein kinase-like protein
MEMEKRSRDRALSICQDYIGKMPRFALIKQLNNIGESKIALQILCIK